MMTESQQTAQQAREQAEVADSDNSDALQQQAEALSQQVSEYTRSHPLAALGMAFAAGVLVSALLRR